MKSNRRQPSRSLKILAFYFAVQVAGFTHVVTSMATTYYSNNFSVDTGALSLQPKWQRVPTGGINDSPCIMLTYDTTGTADHAAVLSLSQFATNSVWVKFAYKVTGTPTGGSKFLKLFGSTQASMNNTTFGMDYYSNTLTRVAYNLDTICETSYTGSTSGGCLPTSKLTHSAINPADGVWHTYKVYLKRADSGQKNGTYRIFNDGVEIVSVYNVDNNPPSGYTPLIDRIEWGGYRNSNGTTLWQLWIDDIVVSDNDPDAAPLHAPTHVTVQSMTR